MTFRVKINLGNDAMQNGSDIAGALRKAATVVDALDRPQVGDSGNLRDLNGNNVGEWHIGR